jgi:hypothetical protein
MTKQLIGPSFIDELKIYGGLVGQHFTWSPDGTIEFFHDTPASVVAGVEAVYAAHDPTKIPLRLQAQAALASGLRINSSSTPTLNGVYTIDALSQADIIAIETSLNAGKGFPGGAATLDYPDTEGVIHSFSEADFSNFATAVRDYTYALKTVISGARATLPSEPATIS